MPVFSLQYHVIGSDLVLVDSVEAPSLQQATAIANQRVAYQQGFVDSIELVHADEMFAIPKANIHYVIVRQIMDRRRTSHVHFDDVDEETPSAPWEASSEWEDEDVTVDAVTAETARTGA